MVCALCPLGARCLYVQCYYIMKVIKRRPFASISCDMSGRYVTAPSPQDVDRQEAKSLGKLNTDEVCQWFTGIGLAKCLPFIRGIQHTPTQGAPSPPQRFDQPLNEKYDFEPSQYVLKDNT